jgi:hypothetical protein
MSEKTILVAVSGGRTSGYMAYWMKNNKREVAEYLNCDSVRLIYVFANTGQEHDDTLRFMRDISINFDIPTVWVEAIVQHGKRKSSQHRVVDFNTAYQVNQFVDPAHPFHSYIRKYGIPNVKFRSCTRELKLNPINSYLKSIDIKPDKIYHAVGIRNDELRRVSTAKGPRKIIYPLIDLNPVDKEDVLDFWEPFEWDLTIPEWQGNCVTCYKKSLKKLSKVWNETPEVFYFNSGMEALYSRIGPEFAKYPDARPRSFFRENKSTAQMIEEFKIVGDPTMYLNDVDAGCSESCEMYETTTIEE